MRKFKAVLLMLVVVLLIASCKTTNAVVKDKSRIETIDHKGAGFGVEMPKWVELALGGARELEALYPDKEVFVQALKGRDLEDLQISQEVGSANTEVSRMIATAVIQNYDGVYKSQNKTKEKKLLTTTEVGSMAIFSGLKKDGDWWILRTDSSGEEEYTYITLYAIDSKLLERQIGILNKKVADTIDDKAIAEDVANGNKRTLELFKTIKDSEREEI